MLKSYVKRAFTTSETSERLETSLMPTQPICLSMLLLQVALIIVIHI